MKMCRVSEKSCLLIKYPREIKEQGKHKEVIEGQKVTAKWKRGEVGGLLAILPESSRWKKRKRKCVQVLTWTLHWGESELLRVIARIKAFRMNEYYKKVLIIECKLRNMSINVSGNLQVLFVGIYSYACLCCSSGLRVLGEQTGSIFVVNKNTPDLLTYHSLPWAPIETGLTGKLKMKLVPYNQKVLCVI